MLKNERRWSVYYELYIDVFFVVNFTMDYILLVLIRKMLRCSGSYRRIALGALLGAFLTCLVVVFPIPYASVKFILFHGLVNVAMVITGLGIKDGRDMIKAWLLLYASGFLLGGVFQFLGQYVRIGSVFFVLAVVSYYVVSGIWSLIAYLARQSQYRCQVILCQGERQYQAQALIDTGNCLKDGLTGQPVSIASRKVMKELCQEDSTVKIRYIPYHSIGKAEGVMPVMTLDGMYVCRQKKQWIEKPLIAVCGEEMTSDRYEVILNPDILDSLEE